LSSSLPSLSLSNPSVFLAPLFVTLKPLCLPRTPSLSSSGLTRGSNQSLTDFRVKPENDSKKQLRIITKDN
jgi:hypothetical protein